MTSNVSITDERRDVRRARWIAITGTAVLTLAIIGPLLRPGTLLLLDWVPGPRPRLSPQFWGFPPGPPSRAPIEVITWVIDHLAPWGFMKMLPLAIAPALAAWGFWRLFKPSPVVVLGATLFLTVNPFMYDRMLAGHLYLVDGFALMPLLLSYLVDGPGLRAAIKAGLVLATQIALSLHFVFISGLLLAAYAIAALITHGRREALSAATGVAAAGALSIYWIIPAIFVRTQSLSLPRAHAEVFRTLPDARFGLFPNVIGLYGFWRSEWPLSKNSFPAWILLLAVIMLVVAVGLRDLLRDPMLRVVAIALIIASVASVLLAVGAQGPTGSLFVWLFERVPGFAAMREAQKFLGLLAVGYAFGFAWGVKVLAEQARTEHAIAGVVLLLMLLPTVYGFRELFGFMGWARPASYPASWAEAERAMGDGVGKLLSLPWHQYSQISWVNGRVLAEPAGFYFARETIFSNDPEVPAIESVSPDALHAYLDFVVKLDDHDAFAKLVAAVGVEYVLLSQETDHKAYAWLEDAPGLEKVREWSNMTLFENTEYIGDAFVSIRATFEDWGEVAGTARSEDVHEFVIDVERAAPGPLKSRELDAARAPSALRLTKKSPVAYRPATAVPEGHFVTPLTPSVDWHYGQAESSANAGVTAAFLGGEDARATVRYGPWSTVRTSYIIGGIVFLLAVVLLIRRDDVVGPAERP